MSVLNFPISFIIRSHDAPELDEPADLLAFPFVWDRLYRQWEEDDTNETFPERTL